MFHTLEWHISALSLRACMCTATCVCVCVCYSVRLHSVGAGNLSDIYQRRIICRICNANCMRSIRPSFLHPIHCLSSSNRIFRSYALYQCYRSMQAHISWMNYINWPVFWFWYRWCLAFASTECRRRLLSTTMEISVVFSPGKLNWTGATYTSSIWILNPMSIHLLDSYCDSLGNRMHRVYRMHPDEFLDYIKYENYHATLHSKC